MPDFPGKRSECWPYRPDANIRGFCPACTPTMERAAAAQREQEEARIAQEQANRARQIEAERQQAARVAEEEAARMRQRVLEEPNAKEALDEIDSANDAENKRGGAAAKKQEIEKRIADKVAKLRALGVDVGSTASESDSSDSDSEAYATALKTLGRNNES